MSIKTTYRGIEKETLPKIFAANCSGDIRMNQPNIKILERTWRIVKADEGKVITKGDVFSSHKAFCEKIGFKGRKTTDFCYILRAAGVIDFEETVMKPRPRKQARRR